MDWLQWGRRDRPGQRHILNPKAQALASQGVWRIETARQVRAAAVAQELRRNASSESGSAAAAAAGQWQPDELLAAAAAAAPDPALTFASVATAELMERAERSRSLCTEATQWAKGRQAAAKAAAKTSGLRLPGAAVEAASGTLRTALVALSRYTDSEAQLATHKAAVADETVEAANAALESVSLALSEYRAATAAADRAVAGAARQLEADKGSVRRRSERLRLHRGGEHDPRGLPPPPPPVRATAAAGAQADPASPRAHGSPPTHPAVGGGLFGTGVGLGLGGHSEAEELTAKLREAQLSAAGRARALLENLRDRDELSAASALAHEALDGRVSAAVALTLRSFAAAERVAVNAHLASLERLEDAVNKIDPASDAQAFIATACERGESVHLESAALEIVHNVEDPLRPVVPPPASLGTSAHFADAIGAIEDYFPGDADAAGAARAIAAAAGGGDEADGENAEDAEAGGRLAMSGLGSEASTRALVVALFEAAERESATGADGAADLLGAGPAVASPEAAALPPASPVAMSRSPPSPGLAGLASAPSRLSRDAPRVTSRMNAVREEVDARGRAIGADASSMEIAARAAPLLSSSPERRVQFLHALNAMRSRRTDVGAGFEALSACFVAVLDGCVGETAAAAANAGSARDANRVSGAANIHVAKMAMMLAQTFFRTTRAPPTPAAAAATTPLPAAAAAAAAAATPTPVGLGEGAEAASPAAGLHTPMRRVSLSASDKTRVARARREYIKDALQDHGLWAHHGFWEEALWQEVRENLASLQMRVAWHDLHDAPQKELILKVHNIVFSQLGAFAHSIVEFGGSAQSAASFVRRSCLVYQLPEAERHTILRMLGS